MKSGKKARAYALFSESFTLFLREKNTQEKVTPGPNPAREWVPQDLTPVLSQDKNNDGYDSKEFLFNHKLKSTHSIPGENLEKRSRITHIREMSPQKTKDSQESSTSEYMENILNNVVENVRPLIEIRKVRVARATYQVPAQISRLKGETLAVRWIIEFANKRKQKDKITLAQALAFELASAHGKHGGPRQRRSELHKLAEANRSYIRYRWW